VLLNKRLVSSSGAVSDNEQATNLVNGGAAATNKWCQRDITPATPGWATFDMTGVYKIDSFKLYHASWGQTSGYDANQLLNTKDYKIEYSIDGEAWVEALHDVDNALEISTYNLSKPILARFVRLTVLVPNNLTDTTNPTMEGDMRALRIQELEAYGSFVQFGTPDGIAGVELTSSTGAAVEKVSDAAGATLTGKVVFAADISRTEAKVDFVSLFAAIYDADGRLVTVSSRTDTVTTAPDTTSTLSVDINVPEAADGFTYKLFIWDGATLVPIDGAFGI
jgi:hypothetical protein